MTSQAGRRSGNNVLSCRNLSAGYEGKTILRSVSLQVPNRGLLALVGPAGVGKSTLLRTLARYNEQLPSFWVEGEILFKGEDLLACEDLEQVHKRVALLAQKARLFTATIEENAIAFARPKRQLSLPAKRRLAKQVLETLGLWEEFRGKLGLPVTELSIARQRMLGLCRLMGGGAECLLVDEPLRDIDSSEFEDLKSVILRAKERVPVIMITHNQLVARALADHVALLVNGRIESFDTVERFFAKPSTELVKQYVTTGNCWPKETQSQSATLQTESAQSDVREVSTSQMPDPKKPKRRFLYPGGFCWVVKGLLGGMQRPGLLRETEEDLAALVGLNVRDVVSLTELPFPKEQLDEHGIEGRHFPIEDMDVPEIDPALELCIWINERVQSGHPTVVHCKAGLGRTGLILACVLVVRGANALKAIHEVRTCNSRYIQTEEQLKFVHRFELAHKASRPVEEFG